MDTLCSIPFQARPNLILDQVTEAQLIYDHFIGLCDKEEEARNSTIDAIMDTAVNCGIILTAVLEEPPTPQELTAIDKYLVGRTIVSSQHKKHLQLCGANGICEYYRVHMPYCSPLH